MISLKCSDKCTKNNSEDEYDSITKGQSVIYFQQEIQTIEAKVSDKTIQNCSITEINKPLKNSKESSQSQYSFKKESKETLLNQDLYGKKVKAFKLSN